MKVFFILLSLLSSISYAEEFHFVDLDEVSVKYISFFPGGRDPLITNNGLLDRELGKLLNLNIKTTIFKYGYWNSLVHSYTDAYSTTHFDGQFRSVGLNMELGIRITPFLDVFAWHYSQHLLDTSSINVGGFPVQDGIGINLYLYRKEMHDSILEVR